MQVNDEAARGAAPGEYLRLDRTWRQGDVVRLTMEMPVSLQEADPRVREDAGSVAIQRGPVVYCLESVDNRGVPIRDAELSVAEGLAAEHEPHLLGGVTVIRGRGIYAKPDQDRGPIYRPSDGVRLEFEETDLKAIPYFAWANRGPSDMKVWIPARG